MWIVLDDRRKGCVGINSLAKSDEMEKSWHTLRQRFVCVRNVRNENHVKWEWQSTSNKTNGEYINNFVSLLLLLLLSVLLSLVTIFIFECEARI